MGTERNPAFEIASRKLTVPKLKNTPFEYRSIGRKKW